jgi:gliding motility-associated-like protein
MNMRATILAAMVLATSGLRAQLVVTTNQTPAQLLQDVLLGSGVTVSNITFNGQISPTTPQAGTGAFTSNNTNMALPAGVILTTGFAQNIAAPASSFQSDQLVPNLSDPDLVAIAGVAINNAAVLEFDFIPVGDTLRFRYVFGSEEYPEFVCSFNDAFGFFLSGPGITGPYTGGAANIALLPGTNIPVTIDNVNNGLNNIPNNPTCPAQNPQFYVNNGTGGQVVYDGMTVVLEVVQRVQCGQTYHIKLAIGDALDQAYDSGVFLEAGSFTSTPFIPSLTPGPGIVGTNTIIESCFTVQIEFTRTGDTSVESVVYINPGGTATPGVDYIPPFPDSLVFPPGVVSIPFNFNCPIDADGTETLELLLLSQSSCSGTFIENSFLFFIEQPPPVVVVGNDVNIQCGDQTTLVPQISGGFQPYTLAWSPGGATTPTLTVSPTAFTLYTATVTDTCGQVGSAQFGVGLIELPPINANILGPGLVVEGCESTSINIIRPVGVPGDLTVQLLTSGTAENGVDYVLPPSVVIPGSQLNLIVPFNPLEDNIEQGIHDAIIVVSFTDDCGRTVQAQVTVLINDAPPIFLEVEPFFLVECSNDSLLLEAFAQGGYGGQLSLEWSSGASGPIAWADMQMSSTYTVTATDACGRTATASTFVEVECDVVIPNVFSPNGDGMNDYWVIDGITSKQNTVRIFNRWGQVVFSTNNYRNNWQGSDLPDGTYFYEVFVTNKGKEEIFTGHLTILRNRW